MSVLHFSNATRIGIYSTCLNLICVYFDYDISRIKVIKNLCLHGRFLIRVLS